MTVWSVVGVDYKGIEHNLGLFSTFEKADRARLDYAKTLTGKTFINCLMAEHRVDYCFWEYLYHTPTERQDCSPTITDETFSNVADHNPRSSAVGIDPMAGACGGSGQAK